MLAENVESKSLLVKKEIEEDFKAIDEQEIEKIFDIDRFKDNKKRRIMSFINYYNKTVALGQNYPRFIRIKNRL